MANLEEGSRSFTDRTPQKSILPQDKAAELVHAIEYSADVSEDYSLHCLLQEDKKHGGKISAALDGYAQTVIDGNNPIMDAYSLTDTIKSFFEQHPFDGLQGETPEAIAHRVVSRIQMTVIGELQREKRLAISAQR